jgi:hypothetical protein
VVLLRAFRADAGRTTSAIPTVAGCAWLCRNAAGPEDQAGRVATAESSKDKRDCLTSRPSVEKTRRILPNQRPPKAVYHATARSSAACLAAACFATQAYVVLNPSLRDCEGAQPSLL